MPYPLFVLLPLIVRVRLLLVLVLVVADSPSVLKEASVLNEAEGVSSGVVGDPDMSAAMDLCARRNASSRVRFWRGETDTSHIGIFDHGVPFEECTSIEKTRNREAKVSESDVDAAGSSMLACIQDMYSPLARRRPYWLIDLSALLRTVQ